MLQLNDKHSSDIFREGFTPSSGFTTDSTTCFFTDEKYYESDFQAVMASKKDLRIWSNSTWPEDDFSSESNKEDLLYHVEDNKTHAAYWLYVI